MTSLVKSSNERLSTVHRLISLLITITSYAFRLSAEISSPSYSADRLFFRDDFLTNSFSKLGDGPTLQSNNSQEILDKMLELVSSKERLLLEGTNNIKYGAPMKIIHGTSAHYRRSKKHPNNVQLLEMLLDADAARLQGHSFSSWSSGSIKYGLLTSKTFRHISGEAGEAGIRHKKGQNSGVVFDRISSGATLGSGQYFADVYIGSPAKKYRLIVDTGSDLLWVQCSPCKKCFRQSNPLYHRKRSSSFLSVPCTSQLCFQVPAPADASCDARFPTSCKYFYTYSDETYTTGILASETVTMMSSSGELLEISNVTFGCGFQNEGRSLLGSNGVLGLGQGPMSLASQLGYRFGGKFSYCLVNHLEPTTQSSLLVFGNTSIKESLKNGFQYTPLMKNKYAETYYYVRVKHVLVNGEVLPIPAEEWQIDRNGYGGTILDSGTTLTYFRMAAYAPILASFRRAIALPRVAGVQVLDLCYNFSAASVEQIPEFSFLLEGNVNFQPPPENYFVDVAPDVKCLAMQGITSPLGSNTIGNLMQQNFLVEYDRLISRLGFVWANCSLAL